MRHVRSTGNTPRSILLALAVAGAIGACAPAATSESGSRENVGVSAAAITAAQAIANAEEWVTAKLLYCQSPNGADDSIDPSCPAICKRQSNAAWDPYRSDCSGLVSWAWGLPAPGRTTAEFAPNQTDITTVIDAASLQPADAVCTDDSTSSDHHIMLFKEWTVAGQTATFIEEPGCSSNPDYAHEFTSAVTISGTQITVQYNGMTFTAIRYGAINGSSGSGGTGGSVSTAPTCIANGVNGTCIDTSVCATMPGYVSTPNLCPGPASEQCCTPTSTGTGGATTTGTSTSGGATSSGHATSGSSSSGHTSSGGTSGGATSSGTGSANASSSGAHGAGGATGSSGSGASAGHGTTSGGIGYTPGASSGCATSARSDETPLVAGASLLAALAFLRRRRPSVRAR
jgi:MYXO-CTERM domain-containing protein